MFQSTEYINLNRSDEDFVADLYYAYLQRAPDSDGYNFWLGVLRSDNAQGLNGREHLIQGFEWSGDFMNLVYSLEVAPPPNTCDAALEQDCYNNGGSWNTNTCSCEYYDPPPDPCRDASGRYICE